MGGLRKYLWAIPLLTALPAPAAAAATDLCATFQRLIAASRERPAFDSVRRARDQGEAIIPGFRAMDCSVNPGTGIACSYTSFDRGPFADWPDPATCPGIAAVGPVPTTRNGPRYRMVRSFAGSGLRFEYGTICRSCAGGTRHIFTVAFDRPRRVEE